MSPRGRWLVGSVAAVVVLLFAGHAVADLLADRWWAASFGPADAAFVDSGRYEVEVAGERVAAAVSRRPFYDPSSLRVKDLG